MRGVLLGWVVPAASLVGLGVFVTGLVLEHAVTIFAGVAVMMLCRFVLDATEVRP